MAYQYPVALSEMRRVFLFVSFLVFLVSAFNCPTGFSPSKDQQSCISKQFVGGSHDYGDQDCRKQNAFLTMPKNDNQNNELIAKNGTNQLLIGLTCLSSTKDSCRWDSGEKLTWNNFANGHPNVISGPCVYLNTKNGQWYSADCTQSKTYGCQYFAEKKPAICPEGFYFFHDSCYLLVNEVQPNDDPQEVCRKNGSNLASIHSVGENNYVYGELSRELGDFSILGLSRVYDNYTWTDDTPVDFKFFGMENPNIGPCVAMSLQLSIVSPPAWINSPCKADKPYSIVCKTPAIVAAPTLAPLTCNGNIYKNGTDTIYSPGYPYPVDAIGTRTTCTYILTEEYGKVVSVNFSDTVIDASSSISFYNGVFAGNTPDETWIYSTTQRTYKATSNFLKVQLSSVCSGACATKFRADFTGVEANSK